MVQFADVNVCNILIISVIDLFMANRKSLKKMFIFKLT